MLTAKEKARLAREGQRMRTLATLAPGPEGLTDDAVAHVRELFTDRELLKVRIRTEDRDECRAAVRQLNREVPCDLVRLVGRVALLYAAPDADNLRSNAP